MNSTLKTLVATLSALVVLPTCVAAELAKQEAATPLTLTVNAPNPNRKLPKFDSPTGELRFSVNPTDYEILGCGLFEEGLMPSSPFASEHAAENKALAQVLLDYKRAGGGSAAKCLEDFLRANPTSRWRPALLVNMGLQYFWNGYFSRSLDAWEEAWSLLKHATEPDLHALADRAAAEFADLSARFGRYDRVEKLFAETKGREFFGSAATKMSRAREGVWMMHNEPGESFRCGPLALYKMRAALGETNALHPLINAAKSPKNGFSLAQVRDIAVAAGMKVMTARRTPNEPMVLPCVVHWKVGHFGALTRQEGNRYLLEDATFRDPLWVSADAVNQESSGYFLIASETLPAGWSALTETDASQVWGRGNAGIGDDDPAPPCTDRCCPNPGIGGAPPSPGMPDYYLNYLNTSYGIVDTPLFYKPPRGPGVAFTVTFNDRESAQPANSPYSNLGRGWRFNWLSYLIATNTANTKIYLPGAGVETHVSAYTDPPTPLGNSYIPNRLTRALLVRLGPSAFERRMPDGSKHVYNLPGPGQKIFMTAMVDSAGNSNRFHFDAGFRLIAVEDAIGQITTVEYNHSTDSNKITRVIDPFDRAATLEYNSAGLLRRVTDVAGLVAEFIGTNLITGYVTPYGTNTFQRSEFRDTESRTNVAVFREIIATDAAGNAERLEFRGTSAWSRLVGDELPPPGMSVDAGNYQRRNTYHFSKRAVAENGDWEQAHIYHWSDSEVNGVVSQTLAWERPPERSRIWYRYANGGTTGTKPDTISLNLPTQVGIRIGNAAQFWFYGYNSLGNITSAIDPLNRSTTYFYASNGIDLIEKREANQIIASFTYNDQHLPLTVVDASRQTNHFTYNRYGQLTSTTNPKGERVALEYDTDGYLRKISGPTFGAKTEFTYDGFGRMRTVTDSEGYTLTYDYDNLNRVTRTAYPDGTYEGIVYNRLDAELLRDRLGQWTRVTHNALRQPIEVVDPLNRTNSMEWCGCGTLNSITDPLGRITRWEYNVRGQVSAKIYPDSTRATYTYHPEIGLLMKFTDPKGQAALYNYRLDNALASVTYSNAQIATPSISLTYDASINRLIRIADGTGTTQFTYHPITPSGTLGAGQLATVDGPWANDTITYSYDELGRVENRSIGGADYRIRYDILGRVTERTNVLGRFTYDYVGVTGRPSAVHYPNGVGVIYDYFDNVGDHRLRAIHNVAPTGQTLSRFDYTYDALGRITSWSQQADTNLPEVWKFAYDSASQLLRAVIHQGSAAGPILKDYAYCYDPAGNRLSEQIDSVVTSSTFNHLNQLLSASGGGPLLLKGRVNEVSAVTVNGVPATVRPDYSFEASVIAGEGTNTISIVAEDGSGNRITNQYEILITNTLESFFAYDANGNTVLASNALGVTTYEWDAENRLVAINQGSSRSEFTHGGRVGFSKVVEKTNGIVTSADTFLWCGLEICERRDATGATVNQRYFPRGLQNAAMATPTTLLYTLDHLGSVRELINTPGVVEERISYNPWGLPTSSVGAMGTPFAFTGHYWHGRSGIHLAPFRPYSAKSGRWLRRDPIGEDGGVNLYAYVLNQVTTSRDVTGFAPNETTDPDAYWDWVHCVGHCKFNRPMGGPAGGPVGGLIAAVSQCFGIYVEIVQAIDCKIFPDHNYGGKCYSALQPSDFLANLDGLNCSVKLSGSCETCCEIERGNRTVFGPGPLY